MFSTFLIMVAIEISLFIDKPNARLFALCRPGGRAGFRGLPLSGRQNDGQQRPRLLPRCRARCSRLLVLRSSIAKCPVPPCCAPFEELAGPWTSRLLKPRKPSAALPFICPGTAGVGPGDRKRKWMEDEEASAIFKYANEKADGIRILPCYAVSDSAADTIVDITATVGASRLIVGAPKERCWSTFCEETSSGPSRYLPEEIHFLVYA